MVLKAGTILINKEEKKIALVYREKQHDYSFPKGHLEKGESLIECAIRETEEEIKRKCKIISENYIYKEHYFDSKNDEVDMYYFLAYDDGKSDNDSTDTHDLIWTDFDRVEDTLSYESLKKLWKEINIKVRKYL